MNLNLKKYLLFLLVFISISACHKTEKTVEQTPVDSRTPVTITSVNIGEMQDFLELNATSAFLQKSFVKATSNGYLQSVSIKLGEFVSVNKVLFSLKTKETQGLGNILNGLDSTFKFSGITKISATQSGYITQLNHQNGDYVQDGEQLAAISEINSFVFLLDLPYELRPYLLNQKSVKLTMPDGEVLTGTIVQMMPTVDAISQTESVAIKVNVKHQIPENLIAKVRIVKMTKMNAISLPKKAILTDETQSNFWVMKMINASTAVKIPIQKGIELGERVEILSPKFQRSDKILVSGNYGLPDTASVKIEKVN